MLQKLQPFENKANSSNEEVAFNTVANVGYK